MGWHKKFTPQQELEILEAVKKAEAQTSGEIVPVLVQKSADYIDVNLKLAFFGLFTGTGMALFLFVIHPWSDSYRLLFLHQLAGMFFGWSLGHFAPITRWVAGKKRMAYESHETAMANFLNLGVSNTEKRTGVLIFLSLLEKRVEIIGDLGIHKAVGQGFWSVQVGELIRGIQSDNLPKALSKVIEEIGAKLHEHFPRSADDKNELPDHLRIR